MSEFRRRLMMQSGKGYEIIDHILTNGLAYIDTGYYPNTATEVEIHCMAKKNNVSETTVSGLGNILFGAYEGDYAYTCNHSEGAAGSGDYYQARTFYFWTNKTYGSGASIARLAAAYNYDVPYYMGTRFDSLGNLIGYCNDKVVTTATPTRALNKTMYLLAINKDTPPIPYNRTDMTFYHFKISERGTLIKHFVPAKQGNIYGMADIIEGKFYASPNGESFDY